jgi:tRNA(Phe) wybutosine-synthesizing methylase Tyw3
MNDHEINRAVQYVTASTCYGRETVATILKTGFGELTDLAVQSTRMFERDALLEYVSQWTDRTARTVGPRGLELCRTVAR